MTHLVRYLGLMTGLVVAASLIGTNMAASDSTQHMTVTITNATNDTIGPIRVKDNGIGTSQLDQTTELVGAQQGIRVSVIKDSKGKYDLTVTLRCGGQKGGGRTYYDSNPILKIEKISDPVGCGITGVKLK